MENKKFLSYDAQISLLKSKGLIIEDEEDAVRLLKEYSYFNLISGYKTPFKYKNGNYKKGTKLKDIYALYQFDETLRQILMKYLLLIELHIKSLLSYAFCNTYGSDEQEYQNVLNYNYEMESLRPPINNLVNIISQKLEIYQDIPYIKHQRETYHNVPLWVLIKTFTFGNVSKMYSLQKNSVQSQIAREFDDVYPNTLTTMLNILTQFRNVCAHNERLYDFKYNKQQMRATKIHRFFHIEKTYAANMFDVIIILKYLLPTETFRKMMVEIQEALNTLCRSTHQIQRTQILAPMGFPAGWEKITDLSIQQLKIQTTIS